MSIEASPFQINPDGARPASAVPPLGTWLRHIRALAEQIGPRGSTTEGERLGHEYCRTVLEGLGLEPKWEQYSSARSVFHPFMLVSLGVLLAFVIYPLAGQVSAVIAALIALGVFISAVFELTLRDNPLRYMIPRSSSQNVFAVLPPTGEVHQDLVLVGHVDSQHAPLIFSSTGWLAFYQKFATTAFVSSTGLVLLYLVGIFVQWSWIWPVSGIAALTALLLALLLWQAVSTPFTHGANDNATAVGLVLTLAGQFQKAPLKNTRLWLVCTGCEEALHDGAIHFFRQHRSEWTNPKALVFEGLGSAGPSWLTGEGIVLPIFPNPGLVALAEKVAKQHPELEGYATHLSGGVTEMSDALRAGIPAITLMGLTRQNVLPNWHQLSDTVDKMDAEALGRNYAFARHFIEALDQQA